MRQRDGGPRSEGLRGDPGRRRRRLLPAVGVWPAGLLCTLLLASCTGEQPPDVAQPPAATVRDSAGIGIVENPTPGNWYDGRWTVSSEPELSIGTVAGDPRYEFMRVDGAARLSDGGWVVADMTAPSVRVYDSGGVFVRSLGGEGQGPGEFNRASLLGVLAGDTVLVSDATQRRILRYSADGSFAQTAVVRDERSLYPASVGVFGDGRVVARNYGHESLGEEYDNVLVRTPLIYASVRPDGVVDNVVATVPGDEVAVGRSSMEGGGALSYTRLIPFGKEAAAAAGGDRLYLGTADRFEILMFPPEGGLARIIRMEHTLRPVTEEIKADLLDAALARTPDPERAAGVREYYSEAHYPDFMPAYRGFRVDRMGYLWVEEYRPSWEGVPFWTVFDPDGQVVARLRLPAGLSVTDIGEDYVMGVMADDMDVQYVRVFRLQRGEG